MTTNSAHALVLLLGLWATTPARAQDAAIIGCKEVGCPAGDNSTSTNCTIGDTTFTGIGVSNNASSPFGTWVQALGANETGDSRTLVSSFYYAAPARASGKTCAVFFHGAKDHVQFDGKNQEEAQGTCADALGDECFQALLSTGLRVDADEDPCEALQDVVGKDVDKACRTAAGGNKWENVTVRALTGDDAPTPISKAQNASSNCWPIRPKTANLTLVETTEQQREDSSLGVLSKFFYGVTPVLTVRYDEDGKRVNADMTCLKAVGPNAAAEATKSDGKSDDDDDESMAASFINVGILKVCIGIAVAVQMVGLL